MTKQAPCIHARKQQFLPLAHIELFSLETEPFLKKYDKNPVGKEQNMTIFKKKTKALGLVKKKE